MEPPDNIPRHVVPIGGDRIQSDRDVFVMAKLYSAQVLNGNVLAIGEAIICPKAKKILGETTYRQTAIFVGAGGWFFGPQITEVQGNIEVLSRGELDMPNLKTVNGTVTIHPGGKANLGYWVGPELVHKLEVIDVLALTD